MKLNQKLSVLVIGLTLIMGIITPGTAITHGELDGEDHPWVVLLLMDVGGEPTYRCTATMLSPTVVLTAGHCTSNYPDDPYTGMRIFTESDVDNGDNTYPDPGSLNSIEAIRWESHPKYDAGPWFMYDVGIVILGEPFYPGGGSGTYGELPNQDVLDTFATQRGRNRLWFTAVGYGYQASSPVYSHNQFDRVRMVSYPKLIQINTPGFTGDFSILLTNNAHTGGTCFGDSGGPNFIKNSLVVGGVTSFGMNGNCAGTGGVYRVDKADDLAFVNLFLSP